MAIQVRQGIIPYLGDEKYWWFLTPVERVGKTSNFPISLVNFEMVAIPAPLINLYFLPFLSWISLDSGEWDRLTVEAVVIGKHGAASVSAITTALASLMRCGPNHGELPGYRTTHYAGDAVSHVTQQVIHYNSDKIVNDLLIIDSFAQRVLTENNQIVVTEWRW